MENTQADDSIDYDSCEDDGHDNNSVRSSNYDSDHTTDDSSDSASEFSQDGFDLRLDEDDLCLDEEDVPLAQRWQKFVNNFEWQMNGEFIPKIHAFEDNNTGLQPDVNFTENTTILDIFEFFYSPDIMDMICNATNSYQADILNSLKIRGKLKKQSRITGWKELEPKDLYTFYAIKMLMSIIQKPSISMYWTTDPLFATPSFQEYMSINKFLMISRYLHFAYDEGDKSDKLVNIRSLFDLMNERIRKVYRPKKI